MDFFRSGLKGLSKGLGLKIDDSTADMIANFASGGLSNAIEHITKSVAKQPEPRPTEYFEPPKPCPYKVVSCFLLCCSSWKTKTKNTGDF